MSARSPATFSFLTSPTKPSRLSRPSRLLRLASVASVTVVLALASAASVGTQHQLQPVSALRGRPALELALRKLDTVGSFMMTTAHPDDENNAMLAYFAHGKGYRTTLLTATHGEGGQNEIGPELFEALAVLRTEELAAAHRFDGAEQFFTRAIDFGYSFSVEETLEKWGKEEILGDFVRMVRTIRPDVIVGFVFGGEGGGQHHQTSSLLTFEAFRAAADPARFPEQISKDGLRPWQPAKVYYTAGFGPPAKPGSEPQTLPGEGAPSLLSFDGGEQFDPSLGRTYNEIGGESRSMHKCQGMSQLLPLPMASGGPMGMGGPRAYRLRDTVLDGGVSRSDPEIFSGVDTSLASLVRFAGPQPPDALRAGLTRIGNAVAEARQQLAAGDDSAVVRTVARGLAAVQQLRADLPHLGLDEGAIFEIGFRLQQKEQQFSEALVVAADVRLDAIARDGLVTPGQSVAVDLLAANRGQVPVGISVQANGLSTEPADACAMSAVAAGGRLQCSRTARIDADARLTAAHFRAGTEGARYIFDADVPFGLPFRPTPYTATFSLTVDGTTARVVRPIESRSEGNIFSGEKRAELHVVPAFSLSVSPDIVIAPLATGSPRAGAARDVRVTVVHHGMGAASAEVSLDTPAGWQVVPRSAPVTFSREDEAVTVRFRLTPPAGARAPGTQTLKARVNAGANVFDRGYQTVEYPHTTRRHVLREPVVTVKSLDLQVKPNLSVGYVMGVGDEVPEALEQIGAKVELIDADTLAWGDLGRFDVLMTGVRAYERRADLRANAQRLIDYARSGGTVIVNYNKFEFNEAQYGPAPIKVGRERVTDENAQVRLLQPNHPVFTTPNRLTAADWQGWVQERGLYFLDTERATPDSFVDLLEFDEPFPYNRGAKRGALVEARVGRGRWLYLGVGLWRQLPAGTEGAYRLMANLLSLGQAPGSSTTDAARPQGH